MGSTTVAEIDLKELVEFASEQAEKIFKKTGAIYPMYHAITAKGESLILTPREEDKDLAVALVKAAFILNDVSQYVFMDEAWILDDRKGSLPPQDWAKIQREGIRNHPDRREAVMFAAENRHGKMLTGTRFILRPENGRPKLSPLRLDDMSHMESSGRMVGLLNPESGKCRG
jgi:hypothetical protein